MDVGALSSIIFDAARPAGDARFCLRKQRLSSAARQKLRMTGGRSEKDLDKKRPPLINGNNQVRCNKAGRQAGSLIGIIIKKGDVS
jgi:hypothetical protein